MRVPLFPSSCLLSCMHGLLKNLTLAAGARRQERRLSRTWRPQLYCTGIFNERHAAAASCSRYTLGQV